MRSGPWCVACGGEGLDVSGIDRVAAACERGGGMMGSALGGILFAEQQLSIFISEGIKAVDPSLALNVFGGVIVVLGYAIPLGILGAIAFGLWRLADRRRRLVTA